MIRNHYYNKLILSALLAVCCNSHVLAFKTHHVAQGESLWGISNKYNITIEQLIKANPDLKDGLKADTDIRIPGPEDLNKGNATESGTRQDNSPQSHVVRVFRGNTSSKETDYRPDDNPASSVILTRNNGTMSADYNRGGKINDKNFYTSVFGDSFSGISRKTGVPVDTIVRLNPFLNESTIPEGTLIRISSTPVEHIDARLLSLEDSIGLRVLDRPVSVVIDHVADSGTLVLALPFDTKAASLSRQGLNATEFYKGLLLAINSHIYSGNISPMKIVAIDTKDGIEKTIKQISDLNLDSSSIIVPADDDTLIAAIEKSGCKATVLNVLSIRNNSYVDNPLLIQCNINQPLMYDKAAGYIVDRLGEYTPVILNPSSGATEKAGFVEVLRKKCADEGIEIIDIKFGNKLTAKDLAALKKDKKYVFIPTSGSTEAFEKFADPLSDYVAADGSFDRLKIFGYPDWVVMRGDNEKKLHNLNAQIYSRFYLDEQNIFTKEILESYEKWYGQPMTNAFPMQAMLGYDTGNLIVNIQKMKWIDSPIERFSNSIFGGEQSHFHFIHDNSKGLINNSLYIIEYLPGETCITTVI